MMEVEMGAQDVGGRNIVCSCQASHLTIVVVVEMLIEARGTEKRRRATHPRGETRGIRCIPRS